MRRGAVFVLVVLGLVAASAPTAPGKADRVDARGVCQTNAIDIFFWPQGHPAIPALGFPAFGPAHVEFHRARDPSNAGALAYVDSRQAGISGAHCSAVADTPMTFASGATPQSTTETQKIRCTFTANIEIRTAAWTRTVRRVVTRTVRVRGKKKKVRRTIRTTVRVGNLATIGMSGSPGALVDVRVSSLRGSSSSLKWDTRSCVPVDVAG